MFKLFRKKKAKNEVVQAIPISAVINPLVRLDVDKIKTVEDVREVLRAMDIIFPQKLVMGKEIEKYCDLSKFVNPRSEKANIIRVVRGLSPEQVASMSEKEIDEAYEDIVRNKDHLQGVFRIDG